MEKTWKQINMLEKDTIRLRPLEPEDIDILYKWENDMSIWELSNTLTPFSKYILAQYIQNSHRDIYESKQLRLIVETLDGKVVGAIDLFDFEPYHQRAGIGILIHNNDDRKKGYATEALNLMCEYSLNNLGLHQIYANITSDNKPSIHLFEKCGFIQSGIKKDWIKTMDGWKDELFFQKSLFPEEKRTSS